MAAAGGEATQHDGGGGEANEAAFDPGFHGGGPFRTLLNMIAMVRRATARWVSAGLRFMSFCFSAR
jgi:hypothetical protein